MSEKQMSNKQKSVPSPDTILKVEANMEPSCVLDSGNNTFDPHLLFNYLLPAAQASTNQALRLYEPEQHARFHSIVCATKQSIARKQLVRIAAQGLLSKNDSKPQECSLRFLAREYSVSLRFLAREYFRQNSGIMIDCPPLPRTLDN